MSTWLYGGRYRHFSLAADWLHAVLAAEAPIPDVNQRFQGQTLILPGAYYADSVAGATPLAPPPTPPLIFIGYGYGGKPLKPQTFVSPQDLQTAIRGGPCSGFVPFLTSPSGQLTGAQVVTFINVGENTQSTLALNNASGNAALTLTSTDYGPPSNLLQCTIGSGSTAGKKVTLFDSFANKTAVGDNLGVPFQLAYTGTASSGVTLAISAIGLNATQIVITSPNAGESQAINIGGGQYTTIAQIAQFLNGTGFYSAVPVGDGTLPATYLDAVSGVTLNKPVSGVNQYVNVTASLGSVIYWVNQYASTIATAAVANTVTGYVAGLAPANVPATSFIGAVGVPPTNTDYANALNVALTLPGWAVFIDSNAAAVQALGAQHVLQASTPSTGAWRRFFTGSNVGDSVATTIAAAQALNAEVATYAYPGIWRNDPKSGVNTLYGGLYAAAAAAGMATGNSAAIPLTNKQITGNGVEVALTLSQINQLQQAGVMCIGGAVPPGAAGAGTGALGQSPPTIISDLTTWQSDNNPEHVFNQQVACRHFVAYSLVAAMKPYVGTVAAPITLTQLRNAVKSTLNALIYTPGGTGVIAAWDPNSLALNYNGTTQTLAITVNVTLVGQNRFITVFVPVQPLNITLTSSQLSAVA